MGRVERTVCSTPTPGTLVGTTREGFRKQGVAYIYEYFILLCFDIFHSNFRHPAFAADEINEIFYTLAILSANPVKTLSQLMKMSTIYVFLNIFCQISNNKNLSK